MLRWRSEARPLEHPRAPCQWPRRTRRATRLRLISVFRRGWNLILVALLDQAPLPMGRFVPEPWPAISEAEAHVLFLPALAVPLAA